MKITDSTPVIVALVLCVFFLAPHSAHAALTYVGSATSSTTGTTDYAMDLTGISMQEGDIVIVVVGFGSESDLDPGVTTSGYTEIADVYSDSSWDANASVNWKIMSATPDSSVTCKSSPSFGFGGVCVAHVWRGVDETTPFDVASTTSTGINSSIPNGPSITPVTTGAFVLTAGLGTNITADDSVTAPTGYSNVVNVSRVSIAGLILGMASKAWTSGAEDPSAWTDWNNSGSGMSWVAVTLALRPGPESPDAPTDLTTTSTTGGVSLSWTAPADPGASNLETYGIWRATSPFTATSSATLIASQATTSTTYNDTSVTLRTNYYYGVTATNSTATSSLSNIRSSSANSGRVIRLGGLLISS